MLGKLGTRGGGGNDGFVKEHTGWLVTINNEVPAALASEELKRSREVLRRERRISGAKGGS